MPTDTVQISQRVELPSTEFIFGSTAGMREIREKIERAAQDHLPVLIEGESGTGKEVIGRFLHKNGIRAEGPFLKLNCGGASARLLACEIFGLEKAKAATYPEHASGSIGVASGGTLFLDEIDGMDSSLQQNLAHILQSGTYRRIDGGEDLLVDARFVCATRIDLEAGVQSHLVDELLGCFAHRVRLLPLRERREDIPQLCEYLLGKFARDFGRTVPQLSARAVEVLQQWKWPGNIRELENWIARIVIFGAEEVVGLEFRRQLAGGEDVALQYHRASHPKSVRSRRQRRHRRGLLDQ
jgi:DNA-binding NtrC family response regulator